MGKVLDNPFTDGRGDKCFGCSGGNAHGLHLEFEEDGDEVFCRWTPDARFQSWDGVLHGGIISTILDETAGWAAMRRFNRSAMTTRLDVKFMKPVRIDGGAIEARAGYVEPINGKIARFHATVRNADGDVCAEADADYYIMDAERSKAMGFSSFGDAANWAGRKVRRVQE